LPDGDRSFLWSTMLNGEPVEVRREADEYLVAVPAGSDGQDYSLTVLFETEAKQAGSFGQLEQSPVQFTIDAGDQQSIPIDVLQQTWKVHYPRTSLLVESDGQFRPTSDVDQPGWLVSLGRLAFAGSSELPRRLIPLAIFLLTLFILTVIVSRRRWKTLAAICVLGLVLFFMVTSAFVVRNPLKTVYEMETSSSPRSILNSPGSAGSLTGSIDDVQTQPMPMVEEFSAVQDPFSAHPAEAEVASASPNFGGTNFLPGPGEPNVAVGGMGGMGPVPTDGSASVVPQSPMSPSASQVDFVQADGERLRGRAKKGSARLSVNVNLDVPADYQTREFISVADTVHQTVRSESCYSATKSDQSHSIAGRHDCCPSGVEDA
jgi:hypothetical protein